MSGHISRVCRAGRVRAFASESLFVHARIVLSVNPFLCLRLPWVDLRVSHPAPSFV